MAGYGMVGRALDKMVHMVVPMVVHIVVLIVVHMVVVGGWAVEGAGAPAGDGHHLLERALLQGPRALLQGPRALLQGGA